MNWFIQQDIKINNIKIGSITNSSVFQIGSAGVIKSLSNLYNTGGFKAPAREPGKERILVPLKPPS